jgi:hypothetical protein
MGLVGNPTTGARWRSAPRGRPQFFAPIFTNGGAAPAGGLVIQGTRRPTVSVSGIRRPHLVRLIGPLALISGGGFTQQGPPQPGFLGGDPRNRAPEERMDVDHIQHAQPIQAPDNLPLHNFH